MGGPNTEQEIIATYENSAKYQGYLESLSFSLRDYPLRNLEADFERVGALGKPVLLVWGDKDTVVPYALAPRAARLTQGTLVTMKNALHGANMQYPEVFNAAVTEFLAH
jgi:pimeloyl-ACP methyl ester carboxylesterase